MLEQASRLDSAPHDGDGDARQVARAGADLVP